MRFWKRTIDVEAELRASRPSPPSELVDSIVARVSARPRPRRARLGLAAALVGVVVAGLAATGGLGYAAHNAARVIHVFQHAASAPGRAALPVSLPIRSTSGVDQYKPSSTEAQANTQFQDIQDTAKNQIAANKSNPACGKTCKDNLNAAQKAIAKYQAKQKALLKNASPDVRNDPAVIRMLDSFSQAALSLEAAHKRMLAACKATKGCSVSALLQKQAQESAKLARLQTEAMQRKLAEIAASHGG